MSHFLKRVAIGLVPVVLFAILLSFVGARATLVSLVAGLLAVVLAYMCYLIGDVIMELFE